MSSEQTKESLKFDERKCPDCGSKEIDFKSGEHFCKKCGMVID